jgi:PAS domain S-box-containing protein
MFFPVTEDIFDFIADQLSDFIIITDFESKIKTLNKPLLDLLPWSREELTDKPLSIIFGKDEDVFQTMRFNKPQLVSIASHNQKIPAQFSSSIVFDRQNNAKGILVIGKDMRETSKLTSNIDRLKKSIKQHREETTTKISLLSDALASVGESVLITDVSQRIIFYNKRTEETFGFSSMELLGKPSKMLYESTDSESFKGNWQGEVIAVKKTGEKFPALLTTSTVNNRNGVTTGIIGVLRDISEIRALVEKLEEAGINLEKRVQLRTEELEKSRILWERTFDSIEDMVSIHNIEDKIVRVNKAISKKFNKTPSELEGKDCCSLFLEEDFADCPCYEVIKSKKTVQKEIKSEKLGGIFIISASPIFNEGGSIEGIVHIVSDITKRKTLEEQLMQSSKMAAIGTLVAGIAHELNNPLTIIMGYCYMLLSDPSLGNDFKERLKKIQEQSNRAKKIIYNLSVFGRNHKLEKRNVDILELIEKTLELINYDLERKDISIIRNFEENLPSVYVDEHQIHQVILNIINNAVDAILSFKNEGTIEINLAREEDKIRLIFSDNGPGIDPRHIKKIFDPFYTTKEVGKGTGLGLSISYGIIKEHNGDIIVKSEPGKGTDFIIDLPVSSLTDIEEKNELKSEEKLAPATGSILVVDDEELIVDVIISSLRKHGYKVKGASDGKKAIELIKEMDFDVVISDYRMPDLSGEKLYSTLVEIKPYLLKKLIYITGEIADEINLSFIRKNNLPVLQKPFDINKLIELVNDLIHNIQ